MAGLNIDKSKSISEFNNAPSRHQPKTSGTIWIESASGEGQTGANNDFGEEDTKQ